ncbi:MAG: (Fe-S)-binding protein [Desulfovibrio sp.]|nr:(Fe-S)-binding protein [Desulfovibrio sp.]
MSDIAHLAQTLMRLDDKLAYCMRCGLCQAVCPVFGATGKEADVTRGKLALLENLAHRMIEDPDAVEEKIGRCLLCGSCQANCPSGVSIMKIFMEARQALAEYKGLPLAKKIVFRQLLTRPALFDNLLKIGAKCQGIVMKPKGANTYDMPLLKGMVGSRHIAKIPPVSFIAKHGRVDVHPAKGPRVLFFPGCMADKYYTNLAEACLKVLKHHGVGVVVPEGLACCGIPALSSGDLPGFVAQTCKNVEVIGRELEKGAVDYIVTPCGSCTSTIKEWWPYYANEFESQERSVIWRAAEHVIDVNAFLVDVLHVGEGVETEPAADAKKVTFHDSCHLKKSLGVSAQPRKLIGLNPRYRLVEMAEADRCCGCGGSFTLFHYDLSKQIGRRKRDNVVASGAATVATGCPACMMQLSDMLSQCSDNVAVKHPIEIYAETLPA